MSEGRDGGEATGAGGGGTTAGGAPPPSAGRRRRLSRAGLIAAALYVAGGAALIHDDLAHSTGGWINLKGMVTGIVVLPVAWPAEALHWPFKTTNPYHAGAALLVCAWLVYWFAAGVVAFVRGLRAPRG